MFLSPPNQFSFGDPSSTAAEEKAVEQKEKVDTIQHGENLIQVRSSF